MTAATRKTKIVCTIGPASESPAMLAKLMGAGMNVARINFSHVTPSQYNHYARLIKTIRQIAKKLNKNIAILQDLCGPKIRVGALSQPISLQIGKEVVLTTSSQPKTGEIPVQWKAFISCIRPGERVLLADGKMELKIISKKGDTARARVVVGGELQQFKGINIPDSNVQESPITAKDKQDLAFGLQQGVDYVAISFVTDVRAVHELKVLIAQQKSSAKTMVKIERKAALEHLEKIVQATDAVMVARGDMGVELPFEQVPLVQKKLIHLCNAYGKPVIVATQMLLNMVDKAVPTRAEVSDVANAILDGADAIMLSEETSVGKYPVRAVEVMHRTALAIEAEADVGGHHWPSRETQHKINPIAAAYNSVHLAMDVQARRMVVFTTQGFTALQVTRFRPNMPIIVVTLSEESRRHLALAYGLNDIYVFDTLEKKNRRIIPLLMGDGKLKKGDTVVTVSVGKQRLEGLMDEIVVFRVQ